MEYSNHLVAGFTGFVFAARPGDSGAAALRSCASRRARSVPIGCRPKVATTRPGLLIKAVFVCHRLLNQNDVGHLSCDVASTPTQSRFALRR